MMTAHLRLVSTSDAPAYVIDSWVRTMQGQGLSNRTITERARVIHQLATTTGADPVALTPTTLENWLATLPSAASRDAYYSIVRAWCHWLVRAAYRDDDPTLHVPRPKPPRTCPRPLTEGQLNAVLALPLRTDTRTKIVLAAWAGMRIHEIAKIRGTDIDATAQTITIAGKGGRIDTLPVHPLILDRANLHDPIKLWFPSPIHPDEPIRAQTVGTVISRALNRAGIKGSAHQLRHRFATSLLAAGVDSRIVQTLMRHENLATTGRYLGVTTEQQRAALTALTTTTASTAKTAATPTEVYPPE